MSNVVDNETGRPLAEGLITHIINWHGWKIGIVSKLWNIFINIKLLD